MSRDQVVDASSAYYCRTEDAASTEPPQCRNPTSIHMLNNYLSKPDTHPIPDCYLYAIHSVTGSLLPAEAVVAAESAKVGVGKDLRHMTMGRIEE